MNTRAWLFLLCAFILVSLRSFGEGSYIVSQSDIAFFGEIRDDLEALEFDSIGAKIGYPIRFVLNGKGMVINNQDEFVQCIPHIVDSDLRRVVLKQDPESLFKNWQGIMVGDGEIWFSEVMEEKCGKEVWVYRIIALNLDAGAERPREE